MENKSSPSITRALQIWTPNQAHNNNLPHTPSAFRFTLPNDWVVEEKPRTTGQLAGMIDKFYYEPGTGQKFRSLISVQRHLMGVNNHTPKSLKPINHTEFKRGSFRLPDGWFVKENVRQSGRSAGRVDKYYCDTRTGRMFRSRLEVERYLAGIEEPARRIQMLREGPSHKKEMAIVAYGSPGTKPVRLPDGWFVMESTRRSGHSVGKIDRYFKERSTGRIFRSMAEVERYLQEMEQSTTMPKSLKPSQIQMSRSGRKELHHGSKMPTVLNTRLSAFELPDDMLLKHISGKSGSSVQRTKLPSNDCDTPQKNVSTCKVKTSSFDFSNPPTKVKWVLTGPGGDMWKPFMGKSMVPESIKKQWAETFIFSTNHKNLRAASSEVNAL